MGPALLSSSKGSTFPCLQVRNDALLIEINANFQCLFSVGGQRGKSSIKAGLLSHFDCMSLLKMRAGAVLVSQAHIA